MVELFKNHTRLIDTLQNFPVEKVTQEQLELVENMVNTQANGRTRDDLIGEISKASMAAGALMAWIYDWIDSVRANIAIPKEYE